MESEVNLKVFCASCGAHIWTMLRAPRRWQVIRSASFGPGPYPPPDKGAPVRSSCPVCKGNPFTSRFRVVTEIGILPARICPVCDRGTLYDGRECPVCDGTARLNDDLPQKGVL